MQPIAIFPANITDPNPFVTAPAPHAFVVIARRGSKDVLLSPHKLPSVAEGVPDTPVNHTKVEGHPCFCREVFGRPVHIQGTGKEPSPTLSISSAVIVAAATNAAIPSEQRVPVLSPKSALQKKG